MSKCSVRGCTTKYNKRPGSLEHVKQHEFPRKDSDQTRYDAWVAATGKLETELPKNKNICCKHFLPADYKLPKSAKRLGDRNIETGCVRLHENAVPTLELPMDLANEGGVGDPFHGASSPCVTSTPHKSHADKRKRSLSYKSSQDKKDSSNSYRDSGIQCELGVEVMNRHTLSFFSETPSFSADFSSNNPEWFVEADSDGESECLELEYCPDGNSNVELLEDGFGEDSIICDQDAPSANPTEQHPKSPRNPNLLVQPTDGASSSPSSGTASSSCTVLICSHGSGAAATAAVAHNSGAACSGNCTTESMPEAPEAASYTRDEMGMDCSAHPHASDTDTELAPRFILVEVSQLEPLLSKCRQCGTELGNIKRIMRGTMVIIKFECCNGHVSVWNSQSVEAHQPMGNVALTSALYLNGLSFTAFKRFARTIRLPIIGQTTFYKNVKKFVSPVLRTVWVRHREDLIKEENEAVKSDPQRGTVLVMDGQWDSPGRKAYLHTLSAQNKRNDMIVDINLMKKPAEVEKGVPDLEAQCCDEVMERLEEKLDHLQVLCTDRHSGVVKIMREKYPSVIHAFDIWHIQKSFRKRLTALCKRAAMRELWPWVTHIMRHLWWCCANCKGDPDLLIEQFTSLLHHIRGEHYWEDGQQVYGCSHGDLDDENDAYLEDDEDVFKELKKLINDPKLLSDLRHAYLNIHTSALESYHNLRLIYLPKRISFSFEGLLDRSILAALDNNNNVGRAEVGAKPVYSKAVQRWVWQCTYTEKSDSWRLELHDRIVDVNNTPKPAEYEDEIEALFHTISAPASSCPVPKPRLEDMPKRYSRMVSST